MPCLRHSGRSKDHRQTWIYTEVQKEFKKLERELTISEARSEELLNAQEARHQEERNRLETALRDMLSGSHGAAVRARKILNLTNQ
jgi:hypothetical protein